MYIICTGDLETVSRDCMDKIINVIEICGCEALSLLAENNEIILTHPIDSVKTLRSKAYCEGDSFQYKAFQKSLEVAKGIVKNVMKQTRKARDEIDHRTYIKANMIASCFQLHSVYFMCVFALSHATVISTAQSTAHRICDYPGMIDCVILAVFVVENNLGTQKLQGEMEQNVLVEESRNYYHAIGGEETEKERCQCLLLVRDMAYSVMDELDVEHLKVAGMLKARLIKSVSKPTDYYAKMQVNAYESYCKYESHDDAYTRDIELKNCISRNDFAKSISLSGKDIRYRFQDENVTTEIRTSGCERAEMRTNSIRRRRKLTYVETHPRLRPVFKICSFFASASTINLSRYRKDVTKEHKTSICSSIHTMENVLSKFQHRIPRILHSEQGQFWFSKFLLDYTLQNFIQAPFLCKSEELKVHHLQKKLHLIKESHIMSASTHINKSSLYEVDTVNKASDTTQGECLSHGLRASSVKSYKLSLFDRLKLASAEAEVESSIFNVKSAPQKLRSACNRTKTIGKKCVDNSIQLHCANTSSNQQKVSVIWSSSPLKKNKHAPKAIFEAPSRVVDIPTEASKLYAIKVNKWKFDQQKLIQKNKEDMEFAQDVEVGKIKTRKLHIMRKRLEMRQTNLDRSIEIRGMKEENIRRAKITMDKKNKEDILLRAKFDEKERFRLKQLFERDLWTEKTLITQKTERDELEKVRIRDMANRIEMNEIMRRNEEESRMKILEERQAAREAKRMSVEREKYDQIKCRQHRFKDFKDISAANVRKGFFRWRRGVLSFYRDARPKEVPWIRYENEIDGAYYYDPISKISQYHEPNDSYTLSASDIAIEEYEAAHGPGSYAVMLADHAWKDEANANGGYYDDRGRWKTLRGYWDPLNDYQWVDMSHGYYNENGEFVSHPEVIGDLDFMV